MDPGHSFTFILASTASTIYFSQALLYFTANKQLFPNYTSNPLFTANRWDWQPHRKLGQSSLAVLCAGSTLLLAPTPRARLSLALLPKSASNKLWKWFLSPTGRLNLGIINEGKLTAVLIIPSSWGFPTGPVRHQWSSWFPSSPPKDPGDLELMHVFDWVGNVSYVKTICGNWYQWIFLTSFKTKKLLWNLQLNQHT
jgi:hypothetical protein